MFFSPSGLRQNPVSLGIELSQRFNKGFKWIVCQLPSFSSILKLAHLRRSNSTSSTRKSLVSTNLWICFRSSSSFCLSSLDLSLSENEFIYLFVTKQQFSLSCLLSTFYSKRKTITLCVIFFFYVIQYIPEAFPDLTRDRQKLLKLFLQSCNFFT